MNNISNKSEYIRKIRDELNLSRDKTIEACIDCGEGGYSVDRLTNIESGKSEVHAEDILTLSKAFKRPDMCRYYCKHLCVLGEDFREVTSKDLGHIAIDTVSSLNKMNQIQARLLDIVADEKISPDEYFDFINIQDTLEKIATAADNLKLWMDEAKVKNEFPNGKD